MISKVVNSQREPERKTPRPHQKEAIADILNVLLKKGDDVRAQAHMACGTGKTLVGLWVSEKLGDRTLLCEPTLSLIAQNVREWRDNISGVKPEILVVCSDETTVKINQDEPHVKLEDIPARVTNNPKEIKEFLEDKSGRKIVVSTYHSMHLVGKAFKKGDLKRFDCVVADEAHRTASKAESEFSLVHYQEVIPSRTRLYLTATPKVYINGGDSVISMDDTSTFGQVAHKLNFSDAIKKGLLSDYRLVVATLPRGYISKEKLEALGVGANDALSQIAVLRAVEKYGLSKVLTFHKTVKRAHELSDSLEYTGKKYLPKKDIWVHAIDGKMPSSTRSNLLKLLSDQPRKSLSVISNCRCLAEGVDVPAIDGVVFFDPKQSEIDIVQAVGRAMRLSPDKKLGTIIVPIIVPENVEDISFLEGTEFKKIAQVMRALRAHDDRFEGRALSYLKGENNSINQGDASSSIIDFNIDDLPEVIRNNIQTKILKIGANLKSDILTEDAILASAETYYKKTGEFPTQHTKDPVPDMPNEKWKVINHAGQYGNRGLTKGRTLSEILKPLKEKYGFVIEKESLTEEKIIEEAEKYYLETGTWPCKNLAVPINDISSETWNKINQAGQRGYRGLTKGRTLAIILKPLKEKYGVVVDKESLTERKILDSAEKYYILTGKFPTQATKEPVPDMLNESWISLDSAARHGVRGLAKGRSLAIILKPLKEKYGVVVDKESLTEKKILDSAEKYYKKTGKFPTQYTKDPVPDMPNETWIAINGAGQIGSRGLTKGRTLSEILKPLKEKYGVVVDKESLTEKKILDSAEKYYKKTGKFPTQHTKDLVPDMANETWSNINNAGRNGLRGLTKGRTLSKILKPLKEKYNK